MGCHALPSHGYRVEQAVRFSRTEAYFSSFFADMVSMEGTFNLCTVGLNTLMGVLTRVGQNTHQDLYRLRLAASTAEE